MGWLFFQVCVACLSLALATNPITDVTSDIGLHGVSGVVAAFGDYNSDRGTDLFVISSNGETMNIYLWQSGDALYTKSSTAFITIKGKVMTNVTPADFDGDGCLDVLVSVKAADHVEISVYWTVGSGLQKGTFSAKMKDEPLLMDFNGDLLPDLFGTPYNSKNRTYWVTTLSETPGAKASFVETSQNSIVPVATDSPSAFVDMNNDYHADLLVVVRPTVEIKSTKFEVWLNKDGVLTNSNDDIPFPTTEDVEHMGQMSFADLDADGELDIVLPICEKDKSVSVYVYSSKKWYKVFSSKGMDWDCPLSSGAAKGKFSFPFVLRLSDYNMDSYPDGAAIVLAKWDTPHKQSLVVFENVACKSSSCEWRRTFVITQKLPVEQFAAHPVLFGLLDIYDNGISDFLVVQQSDSNSGYSITALKNEYSVETTFLKISVLSGRCYKECSCHRSQAPYGSSQLGAMVQFSSSDTNGDTIAGAAVQMPKTSHFALEQPYVVFGLGRTPNFVDKITVGIAQEKNAPNRIREWQSLIPNSQIIIIPYPRNKPAEWMTKLLVTPSKLVLQTGGVLLGLCLLVAGLILVLHVKEKREDEKEKRQDAHKFHFDAL